MKLPSTGKAISIPVFFDSTTDAMQWEQYMDDNVVHEFCFFYGYVNPNPMQLTICRGHNTCSSVRKAMEKQSLIEFICDSVKLFFQKLDEKKAKKRKMNADIEKTTLYVFPAVNDDCEFSNCVTIDKTNDDMNNFMVTVRSPMLPGQIKTLPVLGQLDVQVPCVTPELLFNYLANDFTLVSLQKSSIVLQAMTVTQADDVLSRLDLNNVQIKEWPLTDLVHFKVKINATSQPEGMVTLRAMGMGNKVVYYDDHMVTHTAYFGLRSCFNSKLVKAVCDRFNIELILDDVHDLVHILSTATSIHPYLLYPSTLLRASYRAPKRQYVAVCDFIVKHGAIIENVEWDDEETASLSVTGMSLTHFTENFGATEHLLMLEDGPILDNETFIATF